MEKMVVFGKQALDFPGKNGEQVVGMKLHCTKEAPNQHWEGFGYEGIFVSKNSSLYKTACDLPLQSTIDCNFNRYGKVESFIVCK